jgi:hypothetical protein
VKLFKDSLPVVKPIKPKASRDKSAETFLVGVGLKHVEVLPPAEKRAMNAPALPVPAGLATKR